MAVAKKKMRKRGSATYLRRQRDPNWRRYWNMTELAPTLARELCARADLSAEDVAATAMRIATLLEQALDEIRPVDEEP